VNDMLPTYEYIQNKRMVALVIVQYIAYC